MSKFNLPKSWDEISLQQFIEIKETMGLDSSDLYKAVEMVAILTDKDINDSEIEDMDINEFTKMLQDIKWFASQPPLQYQKQIDEYTCKDINTLTLGEFIDLEFFFNDNFIKNLPKISAILYRKTKKNEWDDIEIEPYDNVNIEQRAKLFEELPISANYGIIPMYLDYKKMFYDNYRNLFQVSDDEEDGELSEEDKNDPDIIKEIAEEKVKSKWSWENILHNLTNGDLTKYDDIMNLNLVFIFNQLSFKKEMKL
jgi:hypothetical protein